MIQPTPLMRPDSAHKRVWEDPGTFGTTLAVLLLDGFGPEAFTWAPETIIHELADTFGVRLPEENLDKLAAAILVITTNEWTLVPGTFNDLARALSGEPVVPGVFVPASAMDCAWGLTECFLLSPPDPEQDEKLDDDVVAFITEVLRDEGFLTPPSSLKLGDIDPTPVREVQADFATDPEMFSAIWEAHKTRTDDIDQEVRERLEVLFTQVERLQLKNGEAEEVRSRLARQG